MVEPKGYEHFEKMLRLCPDPGKRGQVIDVCDSLLFARQWFEAYGVPFTAADLVSTAELILQQPVEDTP